MSAKKHKPGLIVNRPCELEVEATQRNRPEVQCRRQNEGYPRT